MYSINLGGRVGLAFFLVLVIDTKITKTVTSFLIDQDKYLNNGSF